MGKRLQGCFSLSECCRTSPIHDRQLWKEGPTLPSGLGFIPSSASGFTPGPSGIGCGGSCTPGMLQEGRQSFSISLVGQPSFPTTLPQDPPLPAGLSRSLGTLPGPATFSGALLEAGVDGASSPPCREPAGCCNSSASQQLATGQPRQGRAAGLGVLCNVSTPQQAAGPRLKGECCKPLGQLI